MIHSLGKQKKYILQKKPPQNSWGPEGNSKRYNICIFGVPELKDIQRNNS